MAYSTDLADLLAAQLTRFAGLHPHQLAGQVANLDFWLAEVVHCFDVIDRYGERFVRLDVAQRVYAAANGIVASHMDAGHVVHTSSAKPPHRVPDNALRKSRRTLAEVVYRFLVRCRDDHLLNTDEFLIACGRLWLDPDTGRPRNGS